MNQRTTGWSLFVAALGMMATLVNHDVAVLAEWRDATSPAFVGTLLAHFGVVATAFAAGKILPTVDRE